MEKNEWIYRLIPEILQIKDSLLREKVVEVWKKAKDIGKWRSIKNIPFSLFIPDNPVSLVEHTRAVSLMCMRVGEALNEFHNIIINGDQLIAGALLHDVGKLVEYEKKGGKIQQSQIGKLIRHPFLGVWLSLESGIPGNVAHMVATHSYEGDQVNRTLESIILHYCDSLHFNLIECFIRGQF